MRKQTRRPATPGAILRNDYLEPLNLDTTDLSKLSGIYETELDDLIDDLRQIDCDIAIALSVVFDTTPELWIESQLVVDLWDIKHRKEEILSGMSHKPKPYHESKCNDDGCIVDPRIEPLAQTWVFGTDKTRVITPLVDFYVGSTLGGHLQKELTFDELSALVKIINGKLDAAKLTYSKIENEVTKYNWAKETSVHHNDSLAYSHCVIDGATINLKEPSFSEKCMMGLDNKQSDVKGLIEKVYILNGHIVAELLPIPECEKLNKDTYPHDAPYTIITGLALVVVVNEFGTDPISWHKSGGVFCSAIDNSNYVRFCKILNPIGFPNRLSEDAFNSEFVIPELTDFMENSDKDNNTDSFLVPLVNYHVGSNLDGKLPGGDELDYVDIQHMTQHINKVLTAKPELGFVNHKPDTLEFVKAFTEINLDHIICKVTETVVKGTRVMARVIKSGNQNYSIEHMDYLSICSIGVFTKDMTKQQYLKEFIYSKDFIRFFY